MLQHAIQLSDGVTATYWETVSRKATGNPRNSVYLVQTTNQGNEAKMCMTDPRKNIVVLMESASLCYIQRYFSPDAIALMSVIV